MNFRTANILSIGINRQRIGLAVFADGDFEYVTGKAMPAVTSVSGRKQILADIEHLVRRHKIAVIVMPKLTEQQLNSRAVTRVNKGIHQWAIRNGLTLSVESNPQGIDAERLASIYPELHRYAGPSIWERRYYKHIFKAVAAGGAWMGVDKKEGTAHDR